ncbi:MAG TPA: ABC transporter permease [Gemmatimonadota bacterium]|nr:ABC transporter permease [Gemmatimonadota bacterium]
MPFLLSAARKDLLRIRNDWPALLLWIGIPLMVGGLLVLVFGGDASPQAKLLVADDDGTLAGRLLTGGFQQGALADLVVVEPVEAAEGRERMEDGEASGLLVIPEGFGGAVLNGEPAALELVTNPSQTVLPEILEETLDIELEAAEVLRRLFDDPIDRIVSDGDVDAVPADTADGFPADTTVAAIATAFNRSGEEARPWLLPPAIELETVAETGEEFDFARAFFPGMLILAILFMASGLSIDLWNEKRQGTLERALAAPRSAGWLVAGKWLAGSAALAVVSAIGLVAGRWLFGIEVENLPLAFLWLTLVGLALLALFTVVQVLAQSERAGNVLVSAVTLPLAMLGGSFFPFEAMPDWMASLGRLTPNGWALLRLRAVMDGAPEPAVLAVSMAAAAGLALALGWLVSLRLRGWAT